MPLIEVNDLQDPRVAGYRNVKDRDLAEEGDRFVAEGEYLVQRLLVSGLHVESVLMSDRRRANAAKPISVPEHVPLYVAPEAVMEAITGVHFHGGVLAIGRRPPAPDIDRLLAAASAPMLLLCPEITNLANLGAIARVAAGFGVTAMLLGPRCADPWYRKSVRTSMGAVFTLPIIRCDDLAAQMARLRDEQGVQFIAAVLADDAQPLHTIARPPRPALVMGNEEHGVPRHYLRHCAAKAIIPMHGDVDSLNVVVATGIMLYHFQGRNAATL